jgi:hypothetical protein
LEKNADKRPKNFRFKKNGDEKPQFSKEQFNVLLKHLFEMGTGALKKPKKNPKRKVRWKNEEEENKKSGTAEDTFLTHLQKQLEESRINDDSSEEDSESYMLFNNTLDMYPFNSVQPRKKKQKVMHYSAEILVEIQDRNGEYVPIRALLDTGTSATLLLRDFVAKGRAKSYKHHPTKWATLGGSLYLIEKPLWTSNSLNCLRVRRSHGLYMSIIKRVVRRQLTP